MEEKDLLFLNECRNEDLQTLADYLVFDPKDQKKRRFETLSKTRDYQLYYPKEMQKLIPVIAKELSYFGSNDIAYALRPVFGKKPGVPYREILEDVCKKLKVNYNEHSSVELVEQYLLQKVLADTVSKMTPEEVKILGEDFGLKGQQDIAHIYAVGSPIYYRAIILLVQALVKRMGVAAAGMFVGGRLLALLAGPVGLAITGLWALADIAGPAYRVTIPCVILIAYMRATYKISDEKMKEYAQ